MTQAEIKLCSLLLHEHFGEIVEKIGTYLVRTGAQPLRMIVSETGLLLDQVRLKPTHLSLSPGGTRDEAAQTAPRSARGVGHGH